MTKVLIGSCTGHKNPDLWYLNLPRGKASDRQKKVFLERVERTRTICNGCPIKLTCQVEGMKPENLSFGMWGGLLAGERIELAIKYEMDFRSKPCLVKGDPRSEAGFVRADEEADAMLFLEKVREWSANI